MVGVGKESKGREMEGQREEEVSGAGRKRREERRKGRAGNRGDYSRIKGGYGKKRKTEGETGKR